jgi:hypothetical protein
LETSSEDVGDAAHAGFNQDDHLREPIYVEDIAVEDAARRTSIAVGAESCGRASMDGAVLIGSNFMLPAASMR